MLQGLGGVSGGHHGKASVLELVRTLSKREGPMQRHCIWIVKELKRAWPKVREACNLIEAAEAEARGEGLKDASPQSAEASEKAARLERKRSPAVAIRKQRQSLWSRWRRRRRRGRVVRMSMSVVC